MPFDEVQTKALSGKLSARYVKTRQQNGKNLSYIEGWHAVAEANRIFGFDGWDRRTVSSSCLWHGKIEGQVACTYGARVRIRVRAGNCVVTREGSGCGHGKAQTLGQAHEIALKAAETDATKRALSTFGNPFGLALYDREQKGVRQRPAKTTTIKRPYQVTWELRSDTSEPIGTYDDPHAFCTAAQAALETITEIGRLNNFWQHNHATIEQMKDGLPNLAAGDGQHPSDTVHSAYKARLNDLERKRTNGGRRRPGSGTTTQITKTRRIRNKDHLRYVASQPCLICRRKPSEAHHIRYAEPTAIGMKVGDNWTVPLCPVHHRALHDHGNEEDWWRRRATDPIVIAKGLWQGSLATQ